MENKVVIVTGSSSGIGRETAIHFAAKGMNVVVTGRREDRLKQVVNECSQVAKNQASAIAVVADITNAEDAQRIINTAVESFGRIDVLVNNAGSMGSSSIYDNDISEVYDRVMDANVKAAMYLCHLAVPHLEKTKGCIVNVGSCAALRPIARASVYCMSKAALNMLTKCLAIELGPQGIRVNCVNPAYIKETDLLRSMNLTTEQLANWDKECESKYPLQRAGQPIEVAKAIAFLASDDASFTTGECMLIDGGSLFAVVR